MKRKNTILIAGTIAVIILLFIVFRDRSPFGKSNTSFAVDPGNEITRIEFTQGNEKLLLEKRGHNWFLNDTAETRKSGISFIIRILTGIQIKSPVSDELFDEVISGKNIVPLKVKVYEKNRLIKSFILYKTLSNKYGNIMKMKPNSKPFIVSLPGFEGNIGSAFTMNELFWMPYTIFNLLPSEIASVRFENFTDTSSSFEILSQKHVYTLTDLNKELSGWDTTTVVRYLSYFARIPFEEWVTEMGEKENKILENSTPAFRITVITTDSKEIVLSLWQKTREVNGKVETDNDRLYGKTENSDQFFIVRYFDVDPILKRRTYFFSR